MYHEDVVAALRVYFSPAAPTFAMRFVGKSPELVAIDLNSRLLESDVRSAFAVLSSLEATFRVDFDLRCRRKLKDELSIHFRQIEKARDDRVRLDRVRLDEDILEGWKIHTYAPAEVISQLRAAFKFRHWIAHGRYWSPKLGRKYDFAYLYSIATSVISKFPFAV